MSYMVHWSMRPACTRGLNMVHGDRKCGKLLKMAENAHTHGWGKWGTCATWTGVCHRIGTKSCASNISFGRRPNPSGFENGRVAK